MRFLLGGAHATLAALTEAEDSSRLAGRDELMRWGNALRGWALREGRSRSVFQVGVAAPCWLLGEAPLLFLCPSPSYFCPGEGSYSSKGNPKPKRLGNKGCFLKSK